MTSGKECSSREKLSITYTIDDDHIVKKPGFDLTEASTAITDLSLTSLLVGDFFVILNCKPDVILLGEPYFALMVLIELKSGKYIRRIWNRTVGKGTSQTIDHLVDLCKKHFYQGKPCIGFPQNGKEEEDDCNFLTTQTPIPRKISRFCHEVLGIDAKDEDHLCPECRELGNIKEQTSNDIKIGEADIKYEHTTPNIKSDSQDNNINLEEHPVELKDETDFGSNCHVEKDSEPRIDEDFAEDTDIEEHNIKHPGANSDYSCRDCGKIFKSKRSFYGHWKEMHSGATEVHSCPECGKKFGRRSNLKAHREKLHQVKKFRYQKRSDVVIKGSKKKSEQVSGGLVIEGSNHTMGDVDKVGESSISRDIEEVEESSKEEDFAERVNVKEEEEVGKASSSEGYSTQHNATQLTYEEHETHKIGSTVENAKTVVPGMHDELSPNLSCNSDEIKAEITQVVLSSGRPRASPKGRSTKITYGALITEAITNSDKKMLPLSHIYQYIANKYPYFKMENHGWQNSIRHNLSLQRKKFMKVDCPGLKRGCLWTIVGGAHNVKDADVVEELSKSETDEWSKAPKNLQEVEVKCIWCNKGFPSKDTLYEHEKTHQVETYDTDVDCPSCKESIKVTDINTHYEHCSNSSPDGLEIQCKACGKSFQQYKELVSHMKAHMRAEGVKVAGLYHSCDKCGRRFTERARLNQHIRAEHDKIVYTCSECPMTFKYKFKYYQHKNISHSSDMRYNCKHCGKRYGHLSQVRTHERTHEDPKFQCRFCSKMFKSEAKLTAHERYHTGEKPFVCEECGNGYTSREGLRQHQDYMHTKEKRQQMKDKMKRWRIKQGQKEDPSEHSSKNIV